MTDEERKTAITKWFMIMKAVESIHPNDGGAIIHAYFAEYVQDLVEDREFCNQLSAKLSSMVKSSAFLGIPSMVQNPQDFANTIPRGVIKPEASLEIFLEERGRLAISPSAQVDIDTGNTTSTLEA